ncbi:LuxR family two component transcriptional regulator [Leucobacter luti]|uniref:response regulator n=1 Tax=Leucobacter luti TaxID=340320 RepID=UPI0010508F56|nr:response regulator transcription factor [Leucobacter luti]MCW2289182.1 DNA-binding NarL/FixJ family response regulator [Leucobacter luti]TCK39747.1 LuxR family two component transcriptional regulator [Leucobacter luti]
MIRVLLVDDQALVRSGFRIILESEPDLEVVGEAATGLEAVALARDLRPDVICMDVEMPVMDGIEAARQILADTSPAILILTTFGHDRYLFDALAAGVSGFLLKTSRAEQLIDAVHALARGEALLGPDVTKAVLERIAGAPTQSARSAAADPALREPGAPPMVPAGSHTTVPAASPAGDSTALEAAGLTEREREVLTLIAQGHSNAEIAAALFLGESTIKTHVSNVLQKLGVRDRIQAVVWAHTRGAA